MTTEPDRLEEGRGGEAVNQRAIVKSRDAFSSVGESEPLTLPQGVRVEAPSLAFPSYVAFKDLWQNTLENQARVTHEVVLYGKNDGKTASDLTHEERYHILGDRIKMLKQHSPDVYTVGKARFPGKIIAVKQARKNKNRRISKKWAKRYGFVTLVCGEKFGEVVRIPHSSRVRWLSDFEVVPGADVVDSSSGNWVAAPTARNFHPPNPSIDSTPGTEEGG